MALYALTLTGRSQTFDKRGRTATSRGPSLTEVFSTIIFWLMVVVGTLH